jgi:hypothetical protein
MSFHPEKCHVLNISKKRSPICHNYTNHGHTLQHVTSAIYLGCILNSNLDCGRHIHNICNKGKLTISFLQRYLNIVPASIKETAYKALGRPTVEYVSIVLDPTRRKTYTVYTWSNDEMHSMLRTSITTGPASQICLQICNGRTSHIGQTDHALPSSTTRSL